jgi:anaerobic magnesium-protoporphyrin IX monomethyl ester cyclase
LNFNNNLYSLTDLINKHSKVNSNHILSRNTFNNTIAYLASYLKRNHLSFSYITSLNEEEDKFKDILLNNQVLSISIITTLYVTVTPILEIIKKIKLYNKDCKIIVGGPYIASFIKTNTDEEISYLFEKEIRADFYINSSQGEFTLVKLIKAIKENLSVENIENLYYLSNNVLKKNNEKKEENILSDNTVDWSLFRDDNKPIINLRTAISCPFSCAFCGFPETAGKYQTNDVRTIEFELKTLLKNNPSVKSIYFIDDTFNVPQTRFKEILKMIISNNFDFKWHSYIRCQMLDEETVGLMKQSKCEGAFLGIESGSNDILAHMNKKSNTDVYKRGIKLLKETGITTFGSFIIGFPGENLRSIMDTRRFIEESGLDFYRIQPWYFEHITPIWRSRDKFQIEGQGYNWKHYTMDSKMAISYLEKLFLEIKVCIWLPQFDFDFENVWRLKHNGWTMTEIKEVLFKYYICLKDQLLKSRSDFDNHFQDLLTAINK